jgi:hypothetical protein
LISFFIEKPVTGIEKNTAIARKAMRMEKRETEDSRSPVLWNAVLIKFLIVDILYQLFFDILPVIAN